MRSTEPMIVPRKPLAIAATVLAVVLLGTSAFLLYKAYGANAVPTADAAATLDPLTGQPSAAFKPPLPNQSELAISGVAAALAALVAGGFALTTVLQASGPDPLLQQAQDRLSLLVFGGILGGILILLGFALFYSWFSELTAWLNKDEKAKVWKPLTAVLIFLAGATGMFLAAQPARGDERNNSSIRRAVYGVNLALSAVLVFALLLVVNIVVGMKLPARLDTSESGMYSISENNRDFLRGLKQEITIFNTIPENRQGTDVARLLDSFRDANPSKVKVKALSSSLDKTEIGLLKTKFKSTDMVNPIDGSLRYGLLIVTGEDKASFLSADSLFSRTQGQRGSPGRIEFAGESRISREILFLTESNSKAVIYFTQSSGEISISPQGSDGIGPAARAGEQLKSTLIANGNDVRPLVFNPAEGEAKVPDDATVVIVADPTSTLSQAGVKALTDYMRNKRKDGTQGKLILIAGAHNQPAAATLLKTGLEELLDSFGLQLPPSAIYGTPTESSESNEFIAVVDPRLLRENNPIALAYAKAGLPVSECRPIQPKANREGPIKVDPLLFTIEERYTWLEASVSANPTQTFLDFRKALESRNASYLLQRSAISPDGKPIGNRLVGALVSESGESGKVVNRVAVYGFSTFFVDKPGQSSQPAEFLAATVNWLRDRPAIANDANKPYGVYEPNRTMKWNQVFTLPVAVTLIGITTLGIGLWAWRRK